MSLGKRADDSDDSPSLAAGIDRTTGRYLLGVHRLSDQNERQVSTGELREYLDVSPASVTEMIGKLDERGLVEYEKYQGVTLTEPGATVASRLAWRLCVVTNFFGSRLDTDLDDETSYEIGFALPEDGLSRLQELVQHPCTESCPGTRQEYEGCLV